MLALKLVGNLGGLVKDYIPHIKLGRLVRFRLGDIEAWLKQKSHAGRVSQRLSVDELMRYGKH